jgi:hypothetical protein
MGSDRAVRHGWHERQMGVNARAMLPQRSAGTGFAGPGTCLVRKLDCVSSHHALNDAFVVGIACGARVVVAAARLATIVQTPVDNVNRRSVARHKFIRAL